jgi:hypothetical protein
LVRVDWRDPHWPPPDLVTSFLLLEILGPHLRFQKRSVNEEARTLPGLAA